MNIVIFQKGYNIDAVMNITRLTVIVKTLFEKFLFYGNREKNDFENVYMYKNNFDSIFAAAATQSAGFRF